MLLWLIAPEVPINGTDPAVRPEIASEVVVALEKVAFVEDSEVAKRLVAVALVKERIVPVALVKERLVAKRLVEVALVVVREVNVGVSDTAMVEVDESTMLDPAVKKVAGAL